LCASMDTKSYYAEFTAQALGSLGYLVLVWGFAFALIAVA